MPHNKLMDVRICSRTCSRHTVLQVHLTTKDQLFKDSSYDIYTKGYPVTGYANFQDAVSAVPSFRSVGSGRFYDATSQNDSFIDSASNVRPHCHCIHPHCTPTSAAHLLQPRHTQAAHACTQDLVHT
jgi:hypothetical protein